MPPVGRTDLVLVDLVVAAVRFAIFANAGPVTGANGEALQRDDRHSRYLPVTPRLCLTCDLTRNPESFMHTKQDFTNELKGTIQGGFVDLETVQRINTCTAKCAEDLVLGRVESDYARDLTARYSRFRVETESKRFREPKGFLVANRTRCNAKDQLASSWEGGRRFQRANYLPKGRFGSEAVIRSSRPE